MFDLFGKKKKSPIHTLIEQDGIEHVTKRFAEILCDKLKSKDLAYLFVLEELDGASQGNNVSKRFVEKSGISIKQYKGALSKSIPEIGEAQDFLLNITTPLFSDRDLMVDFRIRITDNIMKFFSLGKYANE